MPRLDISRLRKNRPIYLKMGFILSLAFVTYAFNMEVHSSDLKMDIVELAPDEDIVQVPITVHKKKQILPPPPTEQLIEPEIIEETPEFVEELIPEDIPVEKVEHPEPIDLNQIPSPAPIPKMPLAEKENTTEIEMTKTILDFAEVMPRFPGCEDIEGTTQEKKACADKQLLEFIYGKVKFPKLAQEIGEEGVVIISFVVNKKGEPADFKVVREPGHLLGREAIRVLKQMPNWTPGKQRGRKVAVRYKMPVRFHLQ